MYSQLLGRLQNRSIYTFIHLHCVRLAKTTALLIEQIRMLVCVIVGLNMYEACTMCIVFN